MRLDLESMNINAFKNFGMDETIQFPASQVTAIIGKNEDEGGSNGTGKSSLSITPLVNLFGYKQAGLSIKNLENRYLNQSARLVGNYKLDGKSLAVDRILGGTLAFIYDGVPNKKGTAEDVQAELNRILGITPEQLAALSSKAQGEYGGFLLMKDSDKKEFLSSFFDVSFIEKAKEDADAELSAKNKTLASVSGKIQYINDNVISLEARALSALNQYNAVNTESFRATVQAMKDQFTTLDSNKKALESLIQQSEHEFTQYALTIDDVKKVAIESTHKFNDLIKQLELAQVEVNEKSHVAYDLELKASKEVPVPSELNDQLAQIDGVMKEQDRRNKKARELIGTLTFTNMQLKTAQERLTKSDGSSCASCGAPLSPEKIAKQKEETEAAIVHLQNQVTSTTAQIKEYEVSDADVFQAQKFKEAILQNIASFKAQHSLDSVRKEFESVKAVIRSAQSNIVSLHLAIKAEEQMVPRAVKNVRDGLQSAISKIKLDMASVESSIGAKQNELMIAQKEHERLVAEVAQVRKDFIAAFDEEVRLKDEVDVLSRVTQITSKTGFIGYIFDSLLEDLNSEINENLKIIPNARKFSLQFSSDKIAKTTGSVSKAITYQLFSGTEKVEFDTLSGGEKLSVILAVDESLDTVLSRRLGISIGWKFLDEQFYWIDENSKEAILNFYRTKSSNRAYLIVDHTSEFNAAFDNKITIIKNNNIARFAS